MGFRCRCGSGLSGEQLTEEGHYWIGVDISEHMLGMLLLHQMLTLEGHIMIHLVMSYKVVIMSYI